MIENCQNLSIEDYNYYLPPDRIAQYPLEKRDDSKLLVYNSVSNSIDHKIFWQLPEIINNDYIIVRNNTKVFPARFFLKKPTGGAIELLLENPLDNKVPEKALNSLPPQKWLCIMRGRNLAPGLELLGRFSDKIEIKVTILEIVESKRIVSLDWQPANLTLSELLEEIGKIPLPDYIKRQPGPDDKHKYQTVFAQNDGSIAAPTAGLHFTEELNQRLLSSGIEILNITLHVGSGTFVPLKTNFVNDHKMHSEQIRIEREFLEQLYNSIINQKKIIATGTTTVRTLESLYWLGNTDLVDFHHPKLSQWSWREQDAKLNLPQSIERLIDIMIKNKIDELVGETQLMIVPGYKFKIVDGMITNFHLPKSTLLLLVAAFTGREKMLEIYREALNNNYRFLSYGDATLLLNK